MTSVQCEQPPAGTASHIACVYYLLAVCIACLLSAAERPPAPWSMLQVEDSAPVEMARTAAAYFILLAAGAQAVRVRPRACARAFSCAVKFPPNHWTASPTMQAPDAATALSG